jgi:hypothetical protein
MVVSVRVRLLGGCGLVRIGFVVVLLGTVSTKVLVRAVRICRFGG